MWRLVCEAKIVGGCEQGFAMCKESVPGSSTLWGCTSLPQHRELTMVNCGDGHLRLYKYHYPDNRWGCSLHIALVLSYNRSCLPREQRSP